MAMKIFKYITTPFFILLFSMTAFAYDGCDGVNGTLRQDANLRKGPGTDFQAITVLLKGTKVVRRSRQVDWVKLEVPDINASGWVHFGLIKNMPCASHVPEKKEKNIEAKGKKIKKQPITDIAPQELPAPAAQNHMAVHDGETPLRIGIIDIQKIINSSRRGQTAGKKYEQLRRTGLQKNIDQAEEEIISNVIVEIRAVVETYALQHGFTHVLNKNAGSVFYNSREFDITGDIILEYDRQIPPAEQQAP